jgi:predicted nucleic acid-binding protein
LTVAVDTSVAVPLLVNTHPLHDEVIEWWDHQEMRLCGHAVAETYAVLTRLPGDIRVAPASASALLSTWFGEPLALSEQTGRELPSRLSAVGIAGGAVYDALVALAALDNLLPLATRDARARDTYLRLGAETLIVA